MKNILQIKFPKLIYIAFSTFINRAKAKQKLALYGEVSEWPSGRNLKQAKQKYKSLNNSFSKKKKVDVALQSSSETREKSNSSISYYNVMLDFYNSGEFSTPNIRRPMNEVNEDYLSERNGQKEGNNEAFKRLKPKCKSLRGDDLYRWATCK